MWGQRSCFGERNLAWILVVWVGAETLLVMWVEGSVPWGHRVPVEEGSGVVNWGFRIVRAARGDLDFEANSWGV